MMLMLMRIVTAGELAEMEAIAQLAAQLQEQDEANADQEEQLAGGEGLEED